MAARKSSVKTTMLLFTGDQQENCEKLRTVLESESRGYVQVVDLVGVALDVLSLEKKLRNDCDCIVLICCARATKLINDEESGVEFCVKKRPGS